MSYVTNFNRGIDYTAYRAINVNAPGGDVSVVERDVQGGGSRQSQPGTTLITNTIIPERTAVTVGTRLLSSYGDQDFWNHITRNSLNATNKADLDAIFNLTGSEKLSKLLTYLSKTLGWSDQFIAIAVSSDYLLKDGIDTLTSDDFYSFVKNEIVAFEDSFMKKHPTEYPDPLYSCHNFKVVNGTDAEFKQAEEFLKSPQAQGNGFTYDGTRTVTENMINYATQRNLTGVWESQARYKEWDISTATQKSTTVDARVLSAKAFIGAVIGTFQATGVADKKVVEGAQLPQAQDKGAVEDPAIAQANAKTEAEAKAKAEAEAKAKAEAEAKAKVEAEAKAKAEAEAKAKAEAEANAKAIAEAHTKLIAGLTLRAEASVLGRTGALADVESLATLVEEIKTKVTDQSERESLFAKIPNLQLATAMYSRGTPTTLSVEKDGSIRLYVDDVAAVARIHAGTKKDMIYFTYNANAKQFEGATWLNVKGENAGKLGVSKVLFAKGVWTTAK